MIEFPNTSLQFSRRRLAAKYARHNASLRALPILVVAALFLTPWFVPTFLRDVKLERSGVRAQAKVNNKRIAAADRPRAVAANLLAHGGRRHRRFLLAYEFAAAGKIVSRTESVGPDIWHAAQVGQTVDVVYLPADPTACRAGKPIWLTGFMAPFGVGLALSTAAIACAIVGVCSVARNVRLVAEGDAALGIVDAIDVTVGRRKSYISRIAYSYLIDLVNRQEVHRAALESNIPFTPDQIATGDPLVVLCDRANPRRHAVDVFGARSADKERLLAKAQSAGA